MDSEQLTAECFLQNSLCQRAGECLHANDISPHAYLLISKIRCSGRQYHRRMQRLFAVLTLISACCLALAAVGPAVMKADFDGRRRLHIVTADGRDHTIMPKRWQSGGGFEGVKISPDRRSVGWLAEQMLTPSQGGVSYSYAIALELDIWRDGRVVRRFGQEQAIKGWAFVNNGDEVAIRSGPLHGPDSFDCALFDVNSGKELARWSLDRKDYVAPAWARQLLANDPPPNPGA